MVAHTVQDDVGLGAAEHPEEGAGEGRGLVIVEPGNMHMSRDTPGVPEEYDLPDYQRSSSYC